MFELIRSNKRQSVALIAGFVVLLVRRRCRGRCAPRLRRRSARIIALGHLRAMASFSYWKADAIALPVSRAVPADPEQYQRLHNLVEGLCIASGLPKPGVYIVDDPAPNAFATGRDPKHAAIAVTTGLLEKMNRVELEGVLAHELSHIRNYDILVCTLAVTLVGAIALLTDFARPDDVVERWSRAPRRATATTAGNPLAHRRLRVADLLADHRQGDAGGGQPPSARPSPTCRPAR